MTTGKAQSPAGYTGLRREDPTGGRINPQHINELDLEQYLDAADRLMLAAVRGGRFVLAVRCLVCGKPLTSKRSRALGVGPGCRKRGERR